MRLGQIQKRKLVTESFGNSDLLLLEQKVIQPWVAEVEQYVFEATLSQDQINNLFTSIEQGATASGGNRTAIGKGVDVAKLPAKALKWIDDQINKLGREIQKAGPVKNADAQFEKLKQEIGSKDTKVVNAVKAVSDWAKENPGKASIAVGILTAAAAIAGGPLGGAVAGFLARATKDLLQGEKLSTAAGKSLKTAAYGALAGMAFNYITNTITDNIANATDADIMAQWDSLDAAAKEAALADVSKEYGALVDQLDGATTMQWSGNVNRFYFNYDVIMTPDQIAQLDKFESALRGMKTFSPEWTEVTAKMHDFMQGVQVDPAQDGLKAAKAALAAAQEVEAPLDVIQQAGLFDKMDNLEAFIQTAEEVNPAIAAAAQGAVTAAEKAEQNSQKAEPVKDKEGGEAPQESKAYSGQKLSEGQIYLLFNRLTNVNDHMLENKLMFESVFDAVAYYNRQTINEAEPAVAEPEAEAPAEKKPGLLGKLKQGARTIGGAIKGAAKQITTKVTAEKLMNAWKKAGSPTDSDEVYNIIKGLGVADDVIKGTYDSMQITPPAKTDAPDGDQDPGAADADTNVDAPTDSTAGDGGSDTSTTGAADTNAGGDEPAPTDDTTDTTSTSAVDDETALGKAKEQRALKLGRGLSPEEETQVEKEFNQSKKATANKNPAVEPGTKVIYKKADGKEIPGTTTAGDIGQYDPKTHVEVKPDNGKGSFAAPVAQMTTPDGKPVATTASQEPAAGGEEPAQTGSTDSEQPAQTGATNTNTASTSGGQSTDTTTTPQGQETPTQNATGNEKPNTGGLAGDGGQSGDVATTQQPVDINALAAEIKKLKPEAQEEVKKILAA